MSKEVSVSPKPRGARLSPEGREALEGAFVLHWSTGAEAGKPTRDNRAKAIGVSVATLDRMTRGQAVERTTLLHAFTALGVPWEGRFLASEPEREPTLEGLEAQRSSFAKPSSTAMDNTVSPLPGGRGEAGRRTRWAWTLLVPVAAVGTAGIVALQGQVGAPKGRPRSSSDVVCFATLDVAFAAYQRGDYARPSELAGSVADFARRENLGDCLSGAYRLQGDLATVHGEYSIASKRYRAALELRDFPGEQNARAAILEALAESQTRQGDLEEAKASLLAAMRLYDEAGDPVGVALVRRDLGSVCDRAGDHVGAAQWFAQSLAALRGRGKGPEEMDVRARQALVLAKMGRAEAARSTLEECLRYWTAQGHPRWVPATQLQLAKVERDAGRLAVASELYQKARAGFESIGDRTGARQAADGLAATEKELAHR